MTKRGTSNGNSSGSAENRRRRKRWLIETYRANVDASVARDEDGCVYDVQEYNPRLDSCTGYTSGPNPACRCYRCGDLLVFETVTVDRIIPGCQGGTYRRNNIRPACGKCNSETGGALRSPSPKQSTRKRKVKVGSTP